MKSVRYAELHCLSNFSFLRGASHADELVRRAVRLDYRALAITDECSLAGVVRAWDEIRRHSLELQLIVGAEFALADGPKLVLLAQDHAGYSHLCNLITRARRRLQKGTYRIVREDFAGAAQVAGARRVEDGAAATRGCTVLWVPGPDPARHQADACWVRDTFGAGNAWIAVELHRGAGDAARLAALQELGRRSGLRCVAAGDVHMHVRGRRALQDTLTAIRHRCTLEQAGERLFPNGERHLRSLPELHSLYPEELLAETLAVAQRCSFRLDQLRYEYPHELVPEGRTPAEHLRELTCRGAQERWPQGVPAEAAALIEKELALIAELKYEPYFLTVHDIVRHARSQNILCQGRGSAANSAVCYALGVTAVDPARIGMLFERFVSKERHEPPDIDIDFEHQRREEVIQYIYGKYGRERAALAATVISYRPRSAIRDVGKALGLSLDQVDALSGSIEWFDDLKTLPQRLRDIGLDPEAPVMRRLWALVRQIQGFPRHLSQHVGGFVISEHALSSLVPVENAAMPDRTILQWDKDDLESLGLLKVDVLALGMLSAIRRMLDLVNAWHGTSLTTASIPAEDPATYGMLCRGDSVGVFQVESRAQMTMLPRLKPKCFYDLVIEVAIVRPGPIQGGMVHPYLKRRQGQEPVHYPSQALRKVLERTLGVPLFQEQVMQIAMVAAGFSAGEADQVRRSMAAWQRRGGLDRFREKLLGGMRDRGYEPEFAEAIYQQVLGFGSYGFPESHAASFALLVYVSAWLKRHHPAAFCAGLLNSQPMGFYAPAQLVADARRAGVELRPVDVLVSDWDCTLENAGPGTPGPGLANGAPALRLGLRMIRGLPEEEGCRIAALRSDPPRSVDELAARARLSRRALKLLAGAGALGALAGHRHAARWIALGVEKLPELLAAHAAREPQLDLPAPAETQDIAADYRATGLSLGRHPVEVLRPRLARLGVVRASDLPALPDGRRVKVAGLVTHRQRPETASGVIFVSLEDETGTHNLVVWRRVQEQQRRALLASRLMVVTGELQATDGVIHVVAQRIEDCSHWLGALEARSRDFH